MFNLNYMKKIGIFVVTVAMMLVLVPTNKANASTYTYSGSEEQLIVYLVELIRDLQAQIAARNASGYYYNYDNYNYSYRNNYDNNRNIVGNPRAGNSSSNDDVPEVETLVARNVDEDSAEMRGEVDMNDFRNGEVFFVYGEDESQIEDVEDDYDSYSDVDEDGDDLQKVRVDSDLDSDASYQSRIYGLDDRTDYFYQICVGYEDEDNDDVIDCGGVEDFTTDRNGSGSNNDDEPEAETDYADSVDEDSAKLHGSVDMNDFDNGIVFFVYGEDESQIEDVEDDYETYYDVDEDGDDLKKVRVDSDLDGQSTYWWKVVNLDDDTDLYFQICVQYEDDYNDDVLTCGGVEDFTTDRD